MKRNTTEVKIVTVARALAAAEGKADWRQFLANARMVVDVLSATPAETLVDLFPGYVPKVSP